MGEELFLLSDDEYYDTLDRYHPLDSAYRDSVAALLPAAWALRPRGVWYVCSPPDDRPQAQGWKVHVASTLRDAPEVLRRATPVFVAHGTSFKFVIDRRLHAFLNGKNCDPGKAAKFIAAYPRDVEGFRRLVQDLAAATAGCAGPYILSDRRFRDSVVYYRFGGVVPVERCTVSGERKTYLSGPDGALLADERMPCFAPPDWARDPFGQPDEPAPDAITLKDGRFRVQSAMGWRASGLYLAEDARTGGRVVIKEARQHILGGPSDDHDCVSLLKKEFRLLRRFAARGICPRAVDLFQDWEHWFLAEEYVEGHTLAEHAAVRSVPLLRHASAADKEERFREFVAIFRDLAGSLEAMHEEGVVFGDLSRGNVIIRKADGRPLLVDFEGAYEAGVDRKPIVYTKGFVPAQGRSVTERTTFATDAYAFGALMLSYLFPVTPMFALSTAGPGRLLDSVAADAGLPPALRDCIGALLCPDAARRPSMGEVRRALAAPVRRERRRPKAVARRAARTGVADLVPRIAAHIAASASPERDDRLFPADSAVFTTNALSLAHGACGVAYGLRRALGECPAEVLRWILGRPLATAVNPPGLYLGLSGVAWTLAELGQVAEGERVLAAASAHPLRSESPDLFYGVAGWGMTCLRFYLATGDARHLAAAREAGRKLAASAVEEDGCCSWRSLEQVWHGLAHGASGIALFLLYLHQATGEPGWLDLGRRALEFDLRNAVEMYGGELMWPRRQGSPHIVLPYWRYGSAGVGTAVLRYYAVLGEERYRRAAEAIARAADHKYAAFPGQFMGLAGLGCFLLDAARILGRRALRARAWRVAEGIALFAIEKEKGVAFPGDRLIRLSCDYGTGSAGVLVFLARLLRDDGPAFLLDALIGPRGCARDLAGLRPSRVAAAAPCASAASA